MRFHFSIRDLLWLIVVVALAVGWWIDSNKSKAERDKDLRDFSQQIGSLKADVKNAQDQAELWQQKLRLKVMGTLDDEEELRKALPKPKNIQSIPEKNNMVVPQSLMPSTG